MDLRTLVKITETRIGDLLGYPADQALAGQILEVAPEAALFAVSDVSHINLRRVVVNEIVEDILEKFNLLEEKEQPPANTEPLPQRRDPIPVPPCVVRGFDYVRALGVVNLFSRETVLHVLSTTPVGYCQLAWEYLDAHPGLYASMIAYGVVADGSCEMCGAMPPNHLPKCPGRLLKDPPRCP